MGDGDADGVGDATAAMATAKNGNINDPSLFARRIVHGLQRYPDSRIDAVCSRLPIQRTVATSGSPHTVARPCRRFTGFPHANLAAVIRTAGGPSWRQKGRRMRLRSFLALVAFVS